MKKHIIYILVVIGMVAISACDNINTFHDPYLEKGPIIYRAKPDTIWTYTGDKRVQINWILSGDKKIIKTKISWNNGEDEKVVDIQRINPTDTFAVIIDGLDEANYQFGIINEDVNGNQSIPVTVFEDIYGSEYQSVLKTRKLNDLAVTSFGVAQLSWDFPRKGDYYTEVVYDNASDETTVLKVMPEDATTELAGFKYTGTFSYQTIYKPVPEAIDEFSAPKVEADLPVLSTREILSTVSPLEDIAVISWGAADGGNAYTRVSYVNTAGVTVEIDALPGDNTTEISNFVYGGVFSYQSFYKAKPEDVVEFPAPLKESNFPFIWQLDQTSFEVIDISFTDQGDYESYRMIDGSFDSHWHSPWDPKAPMPHHITIDMKREYDVSKFKIYSAWRAYLKTLELEGSLDGTTWVAIGTINFPGGTIEELELTEKMRFRYIKFIATESHAAPDPWATITEVEMWESKK